ncbi:MAG: DUF2520 domain-containing protein, partial [Flavobacterium psychrophilum]
MLKVIVIGSGNVAGHLIRAFTNSDNAELVQAYARHPENLEHLLSPEKITDSLENIKEADIYIISVSDDAIEAVSQQMPFSDRLVVHTSGSMPLEKLSKKNRRGVFYPLQTFSKSKVVDFKEIPLCLEAENIKDYSLLEQ